MNRTYQVIWSKARGCYVVVSEIAKRHSKSPSKTLVAAILSAILTTGAVAPAMAAGDPVTYDDNTFAVITLEGEGVGVGTKITNLADGDLSAASTDAVTGAQLYATQQEIATFQATLAQNSGTIAAAQTDINQLKSSYLTLNSDVNTLKTQVETGFNVLLDGAKVKQVNPANNYFNIATGDNVKLESVNNAIKISAKGDGVIASGDTALTTGGTVYDEVRPVADGNYIATANTTGANLTALDNALKDANDNKANKDASNVAANTADWGAAIGTGAVASGNGELVTGDTVYAETHPAADGNYITAAGTAGANLTALDTAVKANEDAITDLEDGKANVSLDNITDAGKTVIQDATNVVSGDTIIDVTSATENGVKTYTVKANISADGQVASGDTGLVSGDTVYTEVRPAADGNYIAVANTTGANLTALDTAVKANEDAISDLENGKANVSLDNITDAGKTVIQDATNVVSGDTIIDVTSATENGVKTYTVKANISADGQIADGDAGLISGGTAYTELRPDDGNYIAKDNTTAANLTALDNAVKANEDAIDDLDDGKANIELDNINDDGKTVVRELAKEAVKVVAGNHTTVTEGTDGNAKTYAVNVTADGIVASGDTGIVDGGTVFDALQDQRHEIDDALDTKANKDASNVAANTAEWGAAIGTGAVESGNAELVTGGTVYDALQAEARPASDGNYIATANTAGANLTALDNAVKANEDAISDLNDGKANVALDNITDAGKTVIQDATNVVSGDTIIDVTSATENGVKTYTVKANITVDGQVASGDTGLVSGDTVYTEVRPNDGNYIAKDNTTAANLTALDTAVKANEDAIADLDDGKANVDLDNITDDGKTVVRDLAKEAVKVVNGTNTTVTEGEAGNAKTYAVNVTVDGAVESGNTGIVDGGTVFDALQAEARPAADGNYITTANTAGANLTVLDTAVKANEDAISDLNDGKANVSLDNITDAGKTVIQDATNVVSGDTIIDVTSATENGVKTYTVKANITANGQVASGDTGLVSGDTIYTEVRPDDGNYIAKDNTTASNLTALDTAVKTNEDAISDLDDGKANVALDNITDDGKTVVRDLAKESVKVINGEHTTVTEGEDGVAKTYAVNVTVDGAVEDGNTGIVDGGTVYDAIQDTKDEINDALDLKANKDASNVADKTAEWGAAIGTGAVESGNGELVTGGTVYDALQAETRPAQDGNYIKAADTAGTNLTALDTAVKANEDAISELDDGKANVDLDNITNNGETVIKDLAKGAINVVGEDLAIVTKTDVNGVDTYTISVKADGAVASDDEKAVSGQTVFGETRVAADGNYIAAANTAGQNLTALDTALKDVSDIANEAKDGLDGKANIGLDNIDNNGKEVVRELAKGAITVAGGTNAEVVKTEGTVDTYTVNVAADGAVIANDSRIVSGGTVYDALNDAVTNINNQLDGKADINLQNINEEGERTIQMIARDAVKVEGRNHITSELVYDADGNAIYRVEDVIDGAVADGNTGLVDGGTVFDAIKDAKDEVNDATDTKLADYALKDASNVTDAAAWGQAIAKGAVAADDVRAVSGDTVFKALKDNADNTQQALDGKANISLDNLNTDGKNVLQQSAITAVKVADGDNTTVASEFDADGNITYKVNATVDGAVEQGNTGIVDGGTVFEALETAKQEVNDATDTKLEDYALKDASNVADNAEDWAIAIGTGAVDPADTKLVTGATVAGETRVATDGNYVLAANTAGQNLTALDTAVKANEDAISDLTDGKANVALDNITDDGKTVVRELAKEAVKVIDGDNTTVTVGADGDAITYAVHAVADGAVEAGNTGIVTGGTVFDALKDATDTVNERIDTVEQTVQDGLDGKANVGLDNLSDAGKNVLKTSAQEAVKVADGVNTAVTSEYDANGNITYKVEAKATGAVEANNTGLVDGGTVYDALQAQSEGIDEKLDTKANKDASNVAEHAEAWGTAIGTGAVADGDGKLVTGDTVFHAMEGRMATDLSNMDEAAKDVITGLIEVEAGNEHTEVTSNVSREGIKTFTVSALVNGEVAEGDEGAVSGGKVYDALKEQSDATNEALDGKANVGLDNLSDAGTKVLQQSAIAAVKVADGENTTVSSEYDANGNITYKVKANTDGAVEQGNAGIVSGGTVYDALQAQAEDTQEALDTKANVDASNVTDSAAWADKLGTGEVEANNAELVTGDTVYNALKEAGEATQEALDGKANVGLDNLTDAGNRVLQQSAISAVKTEAGNHVEVTPSYDANGNVSYKIDVKDTGAVESGNTELVTGGTVYDALQQAASDTQDALDGKANVNLDNIDADGKKVITGLTDVVAGNENTEVTSAFDADGKKTYTVSALTNGQIAEGNTGIVDGGAIYDALKEQSDAIAEGLDGKANVGLDNLTTDGKTVLRTSAQEAVKVSGEGNAVVTPSYDANGNIDYKIAITEGAVAADDTGLVSGKTVYEALQTQAGEIDDKLDGKANVALDNITREGKDVITNLTEVKAGDAYTNVTRDKADDGKVTYTVNAVVDGAVESGNEGLVTGGQVADAIGEAKSDIEEQIETLTDETNEALDTKANRDMDNLTDAGVREIKTLAQEGVKVEAGDHAEVESTFDQNGNKIYTVSAVADGAVERNNEGLVSGGMVFDETRPAADGEFISKDSSAGENLSALDAALKDTNDAIAEAADSAVKYDSAQKGKVTLEGEDGTKITNLKDADLTDESTDAVTGRQLKATNDIVDIHTEDIAGLKDMSNLTDTGKETVKDLAKDAVGVEAGDRATVTSAEVDGKMVYTVSANNNGVIEAGNTDLVSGNTVFEALQDKADTNLGNLTAEGKDVITGLTEVVAGNNVEVTSAKSDGKVTYTVSALGNGVIEDGNTGLVTGDTVYNALSEVQQATEEALEGKANVDMDNLTDNGKDKVKTLAKEAVKVKGDGYAEVTKEEEDGNNVYTVSVKADGVIEANNTGLVTGGMVANETKVLLDGYAIRRDYTAGGNLMALDNALKDVAEKADELAANTVKYDTDAKSRITLEGQDGTKIDNVKAGALTADSMEAVNGSQLFATNENVAANAEAIEDIKATIGTMEEGEYIDDRNTIGENLKALDDAIVQQAAQTEEALAGKANTDMDNLTDTGKQNVKDLAKEAVTVSAGDHVSIVTTEENGNIDYQVNVVVDGKVEEGNTGIVDGGTVYEAIQEVAADVDEKLEGKANTSLDNITDEGRQVIRDTMAEDLAGKANVDASNVTDANAWGEKIATGEIAEGEVRAVNGDTVNSALKTMSDEFDEKLDEKADKDLGNITPEGEQKIKDVMAEPLAEKADKDLGNITDAGKEVIRETAQDSVKLEDGETTRVSSRIDADGSKIYKVEALADGKIEAGDDHAVSGDTMAKFAEEKLGEVQDGNHVKAGRPMAENINALDTAMGTVEDGYIVRSDASMGENINALDAQVGANTKNIAGLYDNQILIQKEMREGLAKSAALAGLHPFENDSDQKWNLSAAMGGYRGEHAGAVGLFYRPSDRVMISAGTTITDSDNMYNVGVSVALDKGSGMTKNQLKQRVGNLEDIIRKMAKKIDSLEASQVALTGMTKEFPDVPRNHWAHNAVANLHGSDIVQGYPDGEFKGANPMTRYEYAEMLFNALEKGKTLPKEVVSEYSQELEQIRQNRGK